MDIRIPGNPLRFLDIDAQWGYQAFRAGRATRKSCEIA